MLLVADVNVVFSALYSRGVAYDVFAWNRVFKYFEFVAPEYMLFELDGKTDNLLLKSSLSKEEIAEMLRFLKEEIRTIPAEEFKDFLPKAKELLKSHPKDVPYLALALALNCEIFSGDERLRKLSPVGVYPPKKLLEILLGKIAP